MPYNPNATSSLTHNTDGLWDWDTSGIGQWYIGVLDTENQKVYLARVNPFESRGQLHQPYLNNTDSRAINRYASGTPLDRMGTGQLSASTSAWRGVEQFNWLETRPVGQTHHTAVALHYGCNPENCVGFAVIKYGDGFGQLKCASTSLNNVNPDTWVAHSFARATAANKEGFFPGSSQMPRQWRSALATYLKGAPFNITNLAVSDD